MVLALLCVTAQPAAAQTIAAPPAAAARDAAAAVSQLRLAARALGVDDPQSASAFAWESEGIIYAPNQGPTPGVPTETKLRHRQFADFESGLTYLALDFTTPESTFSRSRALQQDSGSGDLLELMSPFPLSVVRLLANRPGDLRLVRSDAAGAVVAGPAIHRIVELELGPDRLPRALSYVISDPLFGDSVRRFEYLDYRRQGGVMVPARVRQTDAGLPSHDMRVTGLPPNGARPAWAEGLTPRASAPPSDSAAFRTEQIAPGVHLLRQIGGADYHALGVEHPDGWMLLETPDVLGDASEVRAALKAIADKPIVYAAATHHHEDHAGGMAAFAEQEVTVLTTPGNVAYFETMLAAPRNFERPTVRARVSAVEPDQRVGPVQFVQISAMPHVQEMLLFYFPEHRILFHSDLGRFNAEGPPEPARAQTCALLSLIDSGNLQIDRIYSGHGSSGTVEDVRRAVSLRKEPCP